jgi:RNA recognition motif-containing protein
VFCQFKQLRSSNRSIGNLPSEKVTKRDLFHVFHKYGKLAQVSIKQAYGFIQFHEDAACVAALAHEQGSEVRGRKMRK